MGASVGPDVARSASTRNPAAVSPNQVIRGKFGANSEHIWQLATRAFSSEVDTGSREENASKQESRARSDPIGTENALGKTVSVPAVGSDRFAIVPHRFRPPGFAGLRVPFWPPKAAIARP